MARVWQRGRHLLCSWQAHGCAGALVLAGLGRRRTLSWADPWATALLPRLCRAALCRPAGWHQEGSGAVGHARQALPQQGHLFLQGRSSPRPSPSREQQEQSWEWGPNAGRPAQGSPAGKQAIMTCRLNRVYPMPGHWGGSQHAEAKQQQQGQWVFFHSIHASLCCPPSLLDQATYLWR